MTQMFRQTRAVLTAAILLLNVSFSVLAQDAPQSQPSQAPQQTQQPAQPQYRVRVTSELVLVNVVARDKKGNLIRGLKKEDFTVTEDGKRQEISTFDFENVDELPTAGPSEETVTGTAATG